VVLLARTAEAHRLLNTQFEKRLVRKSYHALAFGNPPWETLPIHLPLRPNGDRRHRTIVDPANGKPAHTDLRVLERFEAITLLEAVPHTGRTHQIRAHLAAQGLPIVADRLYGGWKSETMPLRRLGLHAWSLIFTHPVSDLEISTSAPYPDDFQQALEQLRRSI
jgi:23S rRNA-/tRNA-specific pseudouridylate synthase